MNTLVVVSKAAISADVGDFLSTHGFEKEDRKFASPNTEYWICSSEFDINLITERLRTFDSGVACMKIENLMV
jgi:hypothetical protein